MIKYSEMKNFIESHISKSISSCSTCMGGNGNCENWNKELGANSMCDHGEYYANKSECEALLKWHNDRYGSIEQTRRDSVKEILKDGLEELIKIAIGDNYKDHSKGGCRQYPHGLQPKKETPKPFATLEEFDLKIIKMFIERRKIKFHQLCLGLGLEREDTNRIIAGIK